MTSHSVINFAQNCSPSLFQQISLFWSPSQLASVASLTVRLSMQTVKGRTRMYQPAQNPATGRPGIRLLQNLPWEDLCWDFCGKNAIFYPTPPLQKFMHNYHKKSATKIEIGNDPPPPLGSFPKIHPFWWAEASLRSVSPINQRRRNQTTIQRGLPPRPEPSPSPMPAPIFLNLPRIFLENRKTLRS